MFLQSFLYSFHVEPITGWSTVSAEPEICPSVRFNRVNIGGLIVACGAGKRDS